MSCLLYPLSYIAVADMVTSDAGTLVQQRCRVPVWLEPQPLAPDVDQDLGEDERRCRLPLRSPKFVKLSGTDAAQP